MSAAEPIIEWSTKSFDQLTTSELYSLLQLRSMVFLVEQGVVYPDLDSRDKGSLHLLGKDHTGEVVAYLRVLPAGVESDDYASIGRVVLAKKYRGCGLGRDLFARGMSLYATVVEPDVPLCIHAQAYLQRFYESFGFVATDTPHMFEGLMHVHMIHKP